jgi:hypothetical protein
MNIREIMIEDDFEGLLRPQTEDEAAVMRASIDAHGYLTPLVVWKDHATLVDGHHRLRDYLRRLQEFNALPKPNVLGRMIKGGPLPPDPPDFIQVEFKDRAAVMEFILTTQEGRRNQTEAERSLARAKFYQSEKMNFSEAEAARRTAEAHDVSVRTVRRDAEFGAAVDALAPVVAAKTGQDLKKVVVAVDGPPRAKVVKAAEILAQNLLTAQGIGEVVTMAITPASKLRLDEATDGKPKAPAWEKPLASFEAVLKKIWAEDDKEQKTAVRRRMQKLLSEFFPGQAARLKDEQPKAEEVSAW